MGTHNASYDLNNTNSMNIGDDAWSIKNTFSKPKVIANFTWTTAQGTPASLTEVDLFTQIFNSVSIWNSIISVYTYFRFKKICFKLQMNSNKFQQGMLAMWFNPLHIMANNYPTDVKTASRRTYTRTSIMNNPHVKLKANQSNVATLEIPYLMPSEYVQFNDSTIYNSMGALKVNIINDLETGEGGPTDVNCALWCWFEDFEVHLPKPPAPIPTIEVSGLDTEYDILDNIEAPPSYKNAVDSNENMLYPVDVPAHSSGSYKGDRLSTVRNSRASKQSKRTNMSPEMSFDKIVTKYSMIASKTITAGMVPGTQIFNEYVTPQLCGYEPVTIGGIANTKVITPTFLSYVASAHQLWAGDIKYKLEVICSDFASLRLYAGFTPSTFANVALNTDNVITTLDVQESKEYEITVPFYSNTSTKRISHNNGDLAMYTARNSVDSYVTGRFIVQILNSLKSPNSVAPTVTLNLYIAGGDNMTFYYPTAPLRNYEPNFNPPPPTIEVSGKQNLSEDTKSNEIVLGNNRRKMVVPPYVGGEKSTFLASIKRFTNNQRYDGSTTNLPVLPMSPIYTESPVQLDGTTTYSFYNVHYSDSNLCYFSLLFALWHGSIRYQFIFPASRNSTGIVHVMYYPEYNDTSATDLKDDKSYNFLGVPFTVTTLSQNNGKSVEIPYISEYFSSLTTSNNNTISPISIQQATKQPLTAGITVVDIQGVGTETQSMSLNVAAGDDFTLQILIQPPLMYLQPDDEVYPFLFLSNYS